MKIPGLPLKVVMEAIQQATGNPRNQSRCPFGTEVRIFYGDLMVFVLIILQWQREKSWAS